MVREGTDLAAEAQGKVGRGEEEEGQETEGVGLVEEAKGKKEVERVREHQPALALHSSTTAAQAGDMQVA